MSKLPTRPAFHVSPENTRKALEGQDARIESGLAARPWTAARLRGLQTLALDAAARRASADPADPLIARDLERAACAGAGLFAAIAAGAGAELETPVPGGEGTVTTSGAAPDPRVADPIDWRSSLLCALAVRHARATELLATVPAAILQALAPADPAWTTLERAALQAFALRRPDAGDRLGEAARAADPVTVPEISRDWVLDVVSPSLQLAFRALARDQAGFDTWIVAAVKGHHHYYQGRAERKKSALSQLALAPLAMACVARDLGVSTTITSDYLPRHLIER